MKVNVKIATVRPFLVGMLMALLLMGGAAGLLLASARRQDAQLTERVMRLSAEVSRLSQEQAMPSVVVARHRDSICYIYALYSVAPPKGTRSYRRPLRTRVSGTGFVVANGLIATNRHVVEPWFDDDLDQAQIRLGGVPRIEKLMAFFPGLSNPVVLTEVRYSPAHDLAVAHFSAGADVSPPRPVPLAGKSAVAGDAVVVVGYPMGVTAMLAKSPRKVYKRLAYSRETVDIARDLAEHYLIRPSATYGHLGDVVEDKLIYDAPTAQGGSGGPIFNSQGEVIGINSAYIDGFAGGTLGISVEALRPLIEEAQQPRGHGHTPATLAAPDAADFSVPVAAGALR